jgi:hypothetical protein
MQSSVKLIGSFFHPSRAIAIGFMQQIIFKKPQVTSSSSSKQNSTVMGASKFESCAPHGRLRASASPLPD